MKMRTYDLTRGAALATKLWADAQFSTHLTEATCRTIANEILANPQAHIDALVKAGVLEKWEEEGEHPWDNGKICVSYTVVQPHVHSFICECGERVRHDSH